MASIITADFVLFALTATFFTLQQRGYFVTASSSSSTASQVCTSTSTSGGVGTCDSTTSSSSLKNSAFVFIKPHANTVAVQNLVKLKLQESGCTILSETDIDGPTIDTKKLIDQHYYAIASKATILPAKDIPVPADKFLAAFQETWEQVLKDQRAYNALDACGVFQCTADELNTAWQSSTAVKFGGGFYCALVTIKDKSLYVFNAFFMTMRSKFVDPTVSIHCYEIEFDATQLSWSQFRNVILGPTDPVDGPPGSLRRTIYEQYEALGLKAVPDKGDNGVHASASPFEGLAEKNNWLQRSIETDSFGQALIKNGGLPLEVIKAWTVDPQVYITADKTTKGSIFDALEDLDVSDCFKKLVELYQYNK